MFTQCPKCQSVFMVSDKDIKAHEGLVRCGNCYSVFNSSWNLTDDPRSDFIGENINPADLKPSANQNFTFSLLNQNAAVPQAADNVSDQSEKSSEEVDELKDQQAVEDTANSLEHNGDDLEPFPEPDIGDDLHTITPEPEVNKDDESMLYFDSGNEGDEETGELVVDEEDKPVAIEDLTILQEPSFTGDIPSLESEDILQAEGGDSEPALDSLTEESMWPGAEVSFENAEDEIDHGMPDLGTPDAAEDVPDAVEGVPEAEISDAVSSTSMISDFTIDETLLESQFEDEPSLDADSKSEALDDDSQAEELLLPEGFMAEDPLAEQPAAIEALDGDPVAEELSEKISADDFLLDELEDSPDQLLHAKDDMAQSSKGDDTLVVPGEYEETASFSIDSLPDSTAEAFALDDEKEISAEESVFITSEDEEQDESYVPITRKEADKDELLHDLDEFPEPGELSDLNYEDTREINALLEAANISQQQIDSAMDAAEIPGEEGDGGEGGVDMDSGEAMLSQDAEVDLTEALSSSEEQSSDSFFDSESLPSNGKQSLISRFKNMLPLGIGRKKAWKEPAIGNTEETQLIQSLHRSRSSYTPPLWVSKYSIIAISGLLIITLLGQIGYFYMDRLVRITPLRPVLEAACSIAGCTVPAIQNVNDIEQLSSRMTGNSEGLKVSSILVNRSIRPQAFPAIELTLTDRAGNTISRRVIAQDKYLNGRNAGEMKPNEAVDINIRFRTPSIRVDGFELRPVSQNWLERAK